MTTGFYIKYLFNHAHRKFSIGKTQGIFFILLHRVAKTGPFMMSFPASANISQEPCKQERMNREIQPEPKKQDTVDYPKPDSEVNAFAAKTTSGMQFS
jgi:hypothetical protein